MLFRTCLFVITVFRLIVKIFGKLYSSGCIKINVLLTILGERISKISFSVETRDNRATIRNNYATFHGMRDAIRKIGRNRSAVNS